MRSAYREVRGVGPVGSVFPGPSGRGSRSSGVVARREAPPNDRSPHGGTEEKDLFIFFVIQ